MSSSVYGVSVFRSQKYRQSTISVLGILLVAAFLFATSTGAMPISLVALVTDTATELEKMVFLEIRSPRVVLSAFVGATLAVAGASLQGLFRNPLADPGLIGVSSGAALGAVCVIVLGSTFDFVPWLASYTLPIAAISGALLCTMSLYMFANRFGQFNVASILLIGIAINSLAGVAIGIFQYISDDGELRSLVFWMMGSFGRANWTTVIPAVAAMVLAVILLFRNARRLDLLQLGESEAFHLGVNVKTLKRSVILGSATMVGAGVALTGIVGFVGLVVPHLVRLLIGSTHRFVLPGSALLGAALTVLADTLARTAVAPAEIPVSLVTSAIGAPFFLWLISRVRHS